MSEGRGFYRIKDTVMLRVEDFNSRNGDGRRGQRGDRRLPAVTSLSKLTETFGNSLKRLSQNKSRDMQDIVNCLGTIHSQLNTLMGYPDELQEVDLSATGMSFGCSEEFPAGTILDIGITLLPYHTEIEVLGEVIRLTKNSEKASYKYSAAIKFTTITTNDRSNLTQHIMQVESRQIKEKRHLAK